MRTLTFTLVSLAFLVGCSEKIQTKPIEKIKQKKIYESFQISLLEEHNKQRKSKGMELLSIDKKLCDYAQSHANKMVEKNWMYHSSTSDLRKVLNSNWVGENVAWGQETEEDVVNSWMWSPGHRWNILGSNYKKVGFGMKKDKNDRKYWCVVFSD